MYDSSKSKIVLLTGGRQDPEELTQNLFSSDLPKLDISFDTEPVEQSEPASGSGGASRGAGRGYAAPQI